MFSKKRDGFSSELKDLFATRLFSWPGHPADKFTIGEATEGVMIFGATGSGKSSGSGAKIARAYLEHNFGGLVLCAKPGERAEWEKYAEETGRTNDLVVLEKGKGEFNPLEFEDKRSGAGAGETINMVNLIMALHDLGRSFMSGGAGGGENERFWDMALRRSISRMIDLLKLSGKSLTISNMQKIMASVLSGQEGDRYSESQSVIQVGDITENERQILVDEIIEWGKKNFCIECLFEMDSREDLAEEDQKTGNLVRNYFLREFAHLSERTKSIVVENFLGLIEPFTSGILEKQFTRSISPDIWPELIYEEGKIIILDFPLKEYLISGLFAQGIYKYCFMQEIERREISDQNMRPVFLWIDEAQYFIQPDSDALFQTTARSSLCATVLLSQNINNLYFAMGQNNPQARAKSLLGNLNHKIFHANSDFDTNQFAANTIGKDFKAMMSLSLQNTQHGAATHSEQLHYEIFPHHFTLLQKGGRKKNGYKTEAIIFKAGDGWSDGKNYLQVTFNQ